MSVEIRDIQPQPAYREIYINNKLVGIVEPLLPAVKTTYVVRLIQSGGSWFVSGFGETERQALADAKVRGRKQVESLMREFCEIENSLFEVVTERRD